MIKITDDKRIIIETMKTTYAFCVLPSGHLEHLYYGRKIHIDSIEGLTEKHSFQPGNVLSYEQGNDSFTLEDICLEMSTLGKGDIRQPMVEVVDADGCSTLDFKASRINILETKDVLKTLPASYDENGRDETLKVVLKDKYSKLTLTMYYTVYSECDCIVRRSVLTNDGEKEIRVKRLLSNQIDFDKKGFKFTTFNGAWAREMKRNDTIINAGLIVNSSLTGTSSSRSNPFVMLTDVNVTEDEGNCYGFNLIYSGNHYEAVEVNSFGKTRFLQGINPQGFEYVLGAGESLESPEAVMSFAAAGYNSLSQNMHAFVNNHVVRGNYKNKVRPVLLNSWEANYFDISSNKLCKLAKEGKDLGVELFVMDDGWFGERNDDSHSLGDWEVNLKKIPGGLSKLADKINGYGMRFGIWVEPEMVNVNSKLYSEHPEWVLEVPDRPHSEGRHQRILDLTNIEVQDYIIDKMTEIFGSANISYVKWDMNRIFSDVYSKNLPANRQGEVAHRYVVGLYRCMKVLTEKFPNILFEGCAAGGNRFDLGILSYFPQIWASDDTDALCRAEIQNNLSYGYPLSVMSAHVSGAPNHQTLRRTPINTRFNVAAFGSLGYECNLTDMSKEDKDKIKEQIETYKKWREVFQLGSFYRGRSYGNGNSDGSVLVAGNENVMEWTVVSKDKAKAVGMLLNKLVCPNTQYETFKAKGLIEDYKYHFYNVRRKVNIKDFGDLVNTVSPIHIKPDSVVQTIAANFVKLDGAVDDYEMYGDALMYAGVKLKQNFGGTGFNEEVRIFKDFESEMFFMERV